MVNSSGTVCNHIISKATCMAAARELSLSDTTASEVRYSDVPPYCSFTSSGYFVYGTDLWYNTYAASTGACSSSYQCLCGLPLASS